MSERVKAKKERDRKKGITRSPDRGELDTRSKLEKLKRLAASAEPGEGSPRDRATSSIARSPTSSVESPNYNNFNSMFLPLPGQTSPFASSAVPGRSPTDPAAAAAAAALSLHYSGIGGSGAASDMNGGGGGAALPQNSNSHVPFPFSPQTPLNHPFAAYNNTLTSLGTTPLFSNASDSTSNDHQNTFSDPTLTHLMLMLAQNPEFQAKMLQAQQQAVASAAVMAHQQQQQQPSQHGQNTSIAPIMGLGSDLNMMSGFPGFGGMFNGNHSTGRGFAATSPMDTNGWPDSFGLFNGNHRHTANASHDPNQQTILSRSFPDGQTPAGLSRNPDKQLAGMDVRLRPPFSAGIGDDTMDDGGEDSRQSSSSRIGSMGKPPPPPSTRATSTSSTTSNKRPGSALQLPPQKTTTRRDDLGVAPPSSASSSSALAHVAAMPTGNDEISLLDRLKNCCRISDVSSSDSGLMVFASRLCLAVPCNFAGLHDHDGQVARGFSSIEAAFVEIRSRQGNMDNQPSSVYLTMGRTAAEKVLQAVKNEMNTAAQASAMGGGENGSVHGRRVGDWIGCKPATGFGISDVLIRKLLQEM